MPSTRKLELPPKPYSEPVRISARDTKLIPRQSPQRPPKPAMKSNQVIFGNLSNSGKHNSSVLDIRLQLTVYSGLPEEDVHNGDVLFVGVVVLLALMTLIGSEMYLTNAPW